MQTPYTPDGLRQYDELESVVAILKAWTVAGPNPSWHEAARDRVRAAMPVLGRALDRLAGMDPDALVSYLGVTPRDPLPADPGVEVREGSRLPRDSYPFTRDADGTARSLAPGEPWRERPGGERRPVAEEIGDMIADWWGRPMIDADVELAREIMARLAQTWEGE